MWTVEDCAPRTPSISALNSHIATIKCIYADVEQETEFSETIILNK